MPTETHPDALAMLDRVVREKRHELAGLARREGLGAEDAVDCVHDALCAFLQMGVRGDLPGTPVAQAPLLAGIVVNTARNLRRRHVLARPHDTFERFAEAASVDAPSAFALLAHAQECVRLRACVNRLCKTQRTVVLMRLLEERPGEDVAQTLGITRGYVDVLLHRAKTSLAVCMTDEERTADYG